MKVSLTIPKTLTLGALIAGCSATGRTASNEAETIGVSRQAPKEDSSSTRSPAKKNPSSETHEVAKEESAAEAFPPANFVAGKLETVPVEGDRTIRRAHAKEGNTHAVVYLHGMCSDPSGAEVWLDEALKYGTFVALRADVPCEDRPGYKWPKDPVQMWTRMENALATVRRERGGELDVREVILVGYSQGAHRAELLAAAFPEKFPRLVLGGPPEAAHPENFPGAKRVAILGGEREDYSHMESGQKALALRGIPSRFFLLPKAPHGSFGPRGKVVMRDVFSWLMSDAK